MPPDNLRRDTHPTGPQEVYYDFYSQTYWPDDAIGNSPLHSYRCASSPENGTGSSQGAASALHKKTTFFSGFLADPPPRIPQDAQISPRKFVQLSSIMFTGHYKNFVARE